jgi:hypothetical protein
MVCGKRFLGATRDYFHVYCVLNEDEMIQKGTVSAYFPSSL